MGRKLDLSGLTNDEAEHVIQVVQRDMKLRKKEEKRLSEMKQELEEEGSRCLLLSKQHKFNEHCCIRCCSPFTFLLNPRRPCLDCHYNVCKSCRTYSQSERGYICAACQKSRLLKTQSLEWYYNNVKSRFKRFGSAKVLKTLYRKHIIEREVSAHEGSVENGSVCDGSDSTLYRQSEGHSMAETLTVALRVAEEAIEEAITKAESYRDSLEKQNEARYLRDHKEELIEELTTTIVQKIIQRGKQSEIQAEYEFVWPQIHSSDLPSPTSTQNTQATQYSHTSSQHGAVAQPDITSSYLLWRSRSVLSLTSDDSPEKGPGVETDIQNYSSLRRESRASSLPGWKSVDRLENSSASSVLQSPDGNWIALQSFQHSRPSLLTKRKSLVFSVLEKESGVVSAYNEMGSNSDPEDQGGWGAALLQFRRRLSDETYYTDSQHDPEWTYAQHPPVTLSPSSGQYTNTETLNSDSETSTAPSTRARRPAHVTSLRKKGPPEPHLYPPYRNPPSSAASTLLRQEVLDVNFNPRLAGDSSDGEERSEQVKRSRRRRKSKRETTEHSRAQNALYSAATAENSALLLNTMMVRRQQSQETPAPLSYQTPDSVTPPELLVSEAMTPEPDYQNTVAHNSSATSPPMLSQPGASKQGFNIQGPLLRGPSVNETLEQELRSKLCELVGQVNERDVTTPDFEAIREAGDESEKLRPKERLESKRDKQTDREIEKLREQWLERQAVEEMDTSDAIRQINIDREMKRERERKKEIERQVERERERQREPEKQIKRDRERLREIETQVERKQERQREMEKQLEKEQERQSGIEREIEKQRKSIRMGRQVQKEPEVRAKSNEGEKQEVVSGTEEISGEVIERNKNLQEDNNETDKSIEEKVRRVSPQRSKSETVFEEHRKPEVKRPGSMSTFSDSTPCSLEEPASPSEVGLSDHALQQKLVLLSSLLQQKYSAASLCCITTEVLKVLNATEELLGEAEVHDPSPASTPLSSGPGNRKLDQHLTKMEENVYLAAGAVYSLEGALSDLEECARSISSSTTETELAFLEDQVATAAAQVQQSELQISDIEARISALKSAGLNVSTCTRFSKCKSKPMPQTLDSSRHQRRKLPAPPLRSLSSEKEVKPEPQVRSMKPLQQEM
ncbi:rab effector MyRIP-like isoform X2 [Myxocyprinus asiaticus]|uniref:rab effector MyRIP-like isoform X2 n=1 Tax=Myxocyprinus asiaticus TaxID=70543 RepID=UPI002221744C|nr:rab effector MyRIP-like isoform X2 [Myxocyprinus asiaticus]